MCCRYVGRVRFRVEGVVGSLSDVSATLSELCFMRAAIASQRRPVRSQQTARFPRSTALNFGSRKTRPVKNPSLGLLSTPPYRDASKKTGALGRDGNLGSTIMTHYTQCSGARTPMTEMAKSA